VLGSTGCFGRLVVVGCKQRGQVSTLWWRHGQRADALSFVTRLRQGSGVLQLRQQGGVRASAMTRAGSRRARFWDHASAGSFWSFADNGLYATCSVSELRRRHGQRADALSFVTRLRQGSGVLQLRQQEGVGTSVKARAGGRRARLWDQASAGLQSSLVRNELFAACHVSELRRRHGQRADVPSFVTALRHGSGVLRLRQQEGCRHFGEGTGRERTRSALGPGFGRVAKFVCTQRVVSSVSCVRASAKTRVESRCTQLRYRASAR
jgi:hypothetical protein